jgi:hypothetical protein
MEDTLVMKAASCVSFSSKNYRADLNQAKTRRTSGADDSYPLRPPKVQICRDDDWTTSISAKDGGTA